MNAATLPKRAEKQAARARKVAQATVVLSLERRFPCFSRNMTTSDVINPADDVDQNMLHIRKDLLDLKLLTEIGRVDRSFRAWLNTRAVDCSLLAKGMWMIPLGLVDEVDERAKQWSADTKKLARILAREKYAPAKEDAKKRLGQHFNESEYPSEEALEASFATRHRWISFNVPAALEEYSKEIAEREGARVEREYERAASEIEQALWVTFSDAVDKLAERLGEDPATGKPRVFRDDATAKIEDFLSTISARNITGNAKLTALTDRARSILKGLDPEKVRKDKDGRATLLQSVEQVKAEIAKLEVIAPKARKFRSGVAA